QPGMGPGMMGGQRHGPGMMGRHPGMMEQHWAEPAESLNSRLTAMKQQLTITPAQEPLWNTYVKALSDQNEARGKIQKEMATSQPQDSLEMETRRISTMETMLAQKKAVLAAYKALLAKLDERQKGILGPAQIQPCNQ
ncbi:MAG: Spy/CpxP family protein refolding chaperone, partial [Magnetococcales bacterium]|nr:Spy/CpxP family protein refolding chaperone [Magnetococcales bacterium]